MAKIYKVRQLLSDSTPELTYEEDSFITAVRVYAKEFGLIPVEDCVIDILVTKANGFKVIVTFTPLSGDNPYIHRISIWGCWLKGDYSKYFSESFSIKTAALSYIRDLIQDERLTTDTREGTTVFVHNLETDTVTEVLVSYKNQPIPYIKED